MSEVTAGLLPVIFLVGPTAVGKSGMAVRLALRLQAEIVSADSVQIYRGLDIGSAKPDAAARAAVPHHCLDLSEPTDHYTVADYRRAALAAIADIQRRGKRVIVAGGSGLYVRALTDGLCLAPAGDEQVRARLLNEFQHDPLLLYRRLQEVDPVAAAVADPRNVRRVVRSLEVFTISGKPLSQWWRETPPPPFPTLQLGMDLPRPELYRRIDERAVAMWSGGLLDECRKLLAAGLPPTLRPLGTLGYRHAIMALQGMLPEVEAQRQMARDTRHFAKRQYTWFRPDARVKWFLRAQEEELLNACRHLDA